MACVREEDLGLHLACDEDLPFARELTRVNMRDYYARHGFIWQAQAFDAQWPLRESYRVHKLDRLIGFLGFTIEQGCLYLRDVQLIEAYRAEGVGSWLMHCVGKIARERGCTLIRLKVFKSNPATQLYLRLGYVRVHEEAELYCMERVV
jgi:GNAT superfamily N-acetyltransferase